MVPNACAGAAVHRALPLNFLTDKPALQGPPEATGDGHPAAHSVAAPSMEGDAVAVDECQAPQHCEPAPQPAPKLAELAHELRTPLAAIVSSAELMADEHFGPLGDQRYKAYASGISSTARHLLEVIEAMLRRAEERICLGASANVDEVAALSLESLRTLAEANRTSLCLETASAARAAMSPTVLRQLLLNLIANAVKHAGLDASVIVRSGLGIDGRAWVEVEDDGPGLPASVALRMRGLKEQFGGPPHRIEPNRDKGHGFGLQITMAMARANGAELELIPVSPHGTRARLTLARVN